MFSIEHDFDATVITLVDEPEAESSGPLREDVVVTAFEDCVTIAQFDPRADGGQGGESKVTLSMTQVRDLFAALDLPEGVYRVRPRR